MDENTYRRILNQFCKFSVRLLKNEACSVHREQKRELKKTDCTIKLSLENFGQFGICDEYFAEEHIFEVQGRMVVVVGNQLSDAIKSLPQDKRDIILLSYFLGMSDTEIGRNTNTIQQTIFKRRKRSLMMLRESLEKEGFKYGQDTI